MLYSQLLNQKLDDLLGMLISGIAIFSGFPRDRKLRAGCNICVWQLSCWLVIT